MSKANRNESADSLWDVDFELADQRISARRNRIRQRLDAVKKVQKMIQVKHIFGYTAMSAGEQFPVQVTNNNNTNHANNTNNTNNTNHANNANNTNNTYNSSKGYCYLQIHT